jgi:hypothetical protein
MRSRPSHPEGAVHYTENAGATLQIDAGETHWHSGESIGLRNAIVRYPKRHMTVVILTNRDEPEPYPLVEQIVRTVIG